MCLTSRDRAEDKEKSKELNILYHMVKFNKAEIVNSINQVLGWAKTLPSRSVSDTSDDFNLLNQFCGFKIGNESYAIPIVNIQEVVKAQFVSSVPKSSKEVKGLINLRGQIVTSISLNDVFQYEHKVNNDHMNIIVKNCQKNFGKIV